MAYVYRYVQEVPASDLYYSESIVTRIIDAIVGIVLFLLAVRFALVFLGANAGNSFMQWLYGITGQLIAPFANIFPAWNLGGFLIEWTTIFAMIVYAILGYLLIRLVWTAFSAFRGV